MTRFLSIVLSLCVFILIAAVSILQEEKQHWDENTPLIEVMAKLGAEMPSHYIKADAELVKRGREMFIYGRTTTPEGKASKRISIYYECTACHNNVREDPDLALSNPESRLRYAQEKDLPLLQGTTMYGTVNRSGWYNGDYHKKYGDLVKPARHDLKGAIQLCAEVCAQGRKLEEWEMEAMLAYLWDIGYKMKDFNLGDTDMRTLNEAIEGKGDKKKALGLLNSLYLGGSPATFASPPEDKAVGYGLEGDAERGQAVYELSCMSCHGPSLDISGYVLDDEKVTFKSLKKNITKDTRFSIYEIIRKGTYSIPGHKPYMPHYTKERMSDQQIEDLRAYIEMRSGK